MYVYLSTILLVPDSMYVYLLVAMASKKTDVSYNLTYCYALDCKVIGTILDFNFENTENYFVCQISRDAILHKTLI